MPAGDETRDLPTSPGDTSNAPPSSSPPDEAPGTRHGAPAFPSSIGPWKILRHLGEGGFGIVYLGERQNPAQNAAIKLIKPGMDTRSVLARFEAERQALALLTHPHIARLLDSGIHENRPYFAMEYVPGQTITDYCEQNKLPVKQRLQLFQQVCQAVQHAHLKTIVHRDISARNVLVAEIDGQPSVKVIDFGIAKALGIQLTEATIDTGAGNIIGNYAYMSPEQAAGDPDIDARTDIYSLGVLLYELLAGERPFDNATIQKAGDLGIRRLILETDPERPSARTTNSPELTAILRRELEWIPLKALRKDRLRRYQTPTALADDIQNYLDNKPLTAGPESGLYRLRKFSRRNRLPLATTAIILTFAVLGTTFYIHRINEEQSRTLFALAEAKRQTERADLESKEKDRQKTEAERQRDEAGKARSRAQQVTDLITKSLQAGDPNQHGKQSMLVSEAMDQAIARLSAGELKDQPEVEADLRSTISLILRGNARPADALAQAEAAYATYKQLFPGDHPKVAESLNRVASCVFTVGRQVDALPMYEGALAMQQRLFQGPSFEVAASLANVAFCLVALGQGEQALPKIQAALEMRRQLVQGDHSLLAGTMNNLASCLQSLGRNEEALENYKAALDMYRRLFTGDSTEIARGMNNVASCLEALGRNREALPNYAAALEMWRRLFKNDHPDVALAMNNLAACHDSLNEPALGLPLHQAALAMRQRLFTDDHPVVAASFNNLAQCLESLGRNTEALPNYEAAAAMGQRLYTAGHPDLAIYIHNSASCLDSLGRSEDALPRYLAATEMWQRFFKDDHLYVAASLNKTGSCLKSLGRNLEALDKFEASLKMFRRLYPGDHPFVVDALINLASCLTVLGRHADAISHYQAALAMQQRLLPADDPDMIQTTADLAGAFREAGRHKDAEPIIRQALAGREKLYGPTDARTCRSAFYLAQSLDALGRADEAAALRAQYRLGDPRHPTLPSRRHTPSPPRSTTPRFPPSIPADDTTVSPASQSATGSLPKNLSL